jgi:hypothetical protein
VFAACAATAQAGPVGFTDEASFLAAVPGATDITFEGLPAGTSFPTGGAGIGDISSFVYDQGSTPLTVVNSAAATSGVNVLQGFGSNQLLNLVFASPVDAAGLFVIASQPLAAGQVSLTTGGAQNAVQRVEIGGTTGTYTLSFNGQTTGALPFNATTASVQAALAALPTIGAGNVKVSGSAGAYVVTFTGALGGSSVNPLSGSGAGGANVALSTLIPGTSGGTAFSAGNGGSPHAATRTITISGASGTYTLSFNGQTTAVLPSTPRQRACKRRSMRSARLAASAARSP